MCSLISKFHHCKMKQLLKCSFITLKLYLVILCDVMFLDSFPQVDGNCVLEFLYEMSEDCIATAQYIWNVQQVTNLCLRLKQRLLG